MSYWSVVDERFDLVPVFDRFLFEERAARGRSEKTTAQYASGLVEFAGWAGERALLGDLVLSAVDFRDGDAFVRRHRGVGYERRSKSGVGSRADG
ncbi:hypothetical protein [Conexibacter sp. S30A1]|uniref:hypothetical protein n=1 Tax=Conexibacter sp. S30A1 TaxID=2937800 RepID=UPI00200C2606|nr:hypothetical protein [Conexibacter sp. S30A1]